MDFDVQGALKAGYSPSEIANYMATDPEKYGFDVPGARKAGYNDDEIIKHLGSKQPTTLLGGIIGAPAAKAVHDAALSVIPGSVQRGAAHAVESLANTADVFGASNVGGYLHSQVNRDQLNASTSAEALQGAWKDGHYGSVLTNLPGAVGEALPQLGAAVAGAAGGAAVGSAIGGPVGGVGGFVAGAAGDALAGVAFQAGDIAKARAKADGRTEPNDADIAAAVASSAILGSLDRIGLGKAAGGFLTSTIKRTLGRETAGTVGTAVGSMVAHGASDAVQNVGQQAVETAGTAQGLIVDPDAVASQAIIGAGARGALGVARSAQDRITGQAAVDAQAAKVAKDRSTWVDMTPEDQQHVTNTAAAGQAMAGVQSSAAGEVLPGPAARTAIAQRVQGINEFTKHLASDDLGVLDKDQVGVIRQAVTAASRPSQTLTSDHIDAINDLPLSDAQRHAIVGTLGELNLLSSPSSLAATGGPLSQALGIAGDVGVHALHVKGAPGFLVKPAVKYLATKAGAGLDRLIGADRPQLTADANRAAAMLTANGLDVPNHLDTLKTEISNSQSAMQAMASALGLDPSNYGPGAAERASLDRQAAAASRKATENVPASSPVTMTPAEAVAVARAGMKTGMGSGTPQETAQTPSGPAGSGVATGTPGASTGLPESSARLSDQAPEMTLTPPPSAAAMAQRLPRWMWAMGQNIQKDLAVSGSPKNVNYAKEAAATIGALRDGGVIDGPMHDRLMTYEGRTMPQGFYNLIRQQWLLNHGIDRRTLAAQAADSKTTH